MNQDKTFLGTEPIGKLLRQLAIPTVIAQLVNMLYNIVDRIYIGHIPGDGDLVENVWMFVRKTASKENPVIFI